MDNSAWKKDKDLIIEAYGSVNETNHNGHDACAAGEYWCEKDKKCKPDPDADKEAVKTEELDTPEDPIDEPTGMDGGIDAVDEMPGVEQPIQQEIPQEAVPLLKELQNPSLDLEQLAREGRLNDYVAFLNDLLKTAEDLNNLKAPPEAVS